MDWRDGRGSFSAKQISIFYFDCAQTSTRPVLFSCCFPPLFAGLGGGEQLDMEPSLHSQHVFGGRQLLCARLPPSYQADN